MHASIPLSVLALAASALAAPVVVYETKVVTVMYTEGAAQPTSTAPAQAQGYPQGYHGHQHHSRSRKPSSKVVVTSTKAPVVPTSTVVYSPVLPPSSSAAPPVTTSEKPVTTEAPTVVVPTSSAAPASTGTPSTGYMAVVDEWRAKLGLDKITQDAKMEANVLDCLKSSPGVMTHKLNSGSFGQVLAPGSFSDFEHIFVGGWLCEVPATPGLDGVCTEQSKGWSYTGEDGQPQTGHNEILVDPQYTKIGCAEFDGIVGCDVSYGDY